MQSINMSKLHVWERLARGKFIGAFALWSTTLFKTRGEKVQHNFDSMVAVHLSEISVHSSLQKKSINFKGH